MANSDSNESNIVTVTIWSLVLCAALYAFGHFVISS